MDTTSNHDASSVSASVSVHSGPESEFNKSSTSRRTSAGVESTGETITNFELDIACICERLTNLNLLLMRVETKDSEFEAFVPDLDLDLSDLGVKQLEIDLLSGFLDSEMKVLETHISYLKMDKDNIRELLSSREHLAESLKGLEDMFYDSETSLEQSLEQVSEIKARSAELQKNLSRFAGEEAYKDHAESSYNNHLPELKEKMKMQTVEHQRHVLRMLEKSLAREIDMEKRVSDSIQIEETLRMRLQSLEQEVLYAEEEAEITLDKLYPTDHTSELLMQISGELLSKIKMLQFNLRGSVQREADLKNSLREFEKRESELQPDNEKASVAETMEMENTNKDLLKQIVELENRAVNAEDTSNKLKDTNEKVVLLEKEVSDAKVKLQHMEACYDASQEEKSMLNSTIKDMGNVIDDLKNQMKRKVSQAEVQIESVEDRCILLSESNEDLKKDLSFARSRVKCLEASLHQNEEIKKTTAKDISLRTKLIVDLVTQIALERERLQKQMSSIKQENKILVKRLKKTDKDRGLSENDSTTMTGTKNKESTSTCFEGVTGPTRNIDARELKPKYILLVLLVLIIPLLGILFHQTQVR